MRGKLSAPLSGPDLALIVGAYFADLWHEHRKALLRLWGFTEKDPKGAHPSSSLHKKLAELPAAELARCLLDCALVGELRSSPWNDSRPERLLAFAARHKINAEAIRRQSSVDFEDKAKAEKARKRRA